MYFNLLLTLKYDCEKKLNTLKYLLDLYISNKNFHMYGICLASD